MVKLCAVLLLYSMAMAVPKVQGIDESPAEVAKWFKNLHKMKEKVTKLHFYFHDQVSGKNATVVRVAQAKTTFQSPNVFGLVLVIDDLLTTGPESNSTIVGRAQGMYYSAGLEESVAVMNLDFVFTSGKYNGSTLSMSGRNPVPHPYREMPIVGGSGAFRLARGIATANTYWVNTTTADAIVEYNLIVLHY